MRFGCGRRGISFGSLPRFNLPAPVVQLEQERLRDNLSAALTSSGYGDPTPGFHRLPRCKRCGVGEAGRGPLPAGPATDVEDRRDQTLPALFAFGISAVAAFVIPSSGNVLNAELSNLGHSWSRVLLAGRDPMLVRSTAASVPAYRDLIRNPFQQSLREK